GGESTPPPSGGGAGDTSSGGTSGPPPGMDDLGTQGASAEDAGSKGSGDTTDLVKPNQNPLNLPPPPDDQTVASNDDGTQGNVGIDGAIKRKTVHDFVEIAHSNVPLK